MKELADIFHGFEQVCTGERPGGGGGALATVVAVEGSSYRQPGARMLSAGDGRTWGGVSGGCLERDVARRSRGVIETGRPVLCRFDTSEEDMGPAGAAPPGCRGLIDVWIEPVTAAAPGVIPVLADVLRRRRPSAVATVLEPQAIAQGRGHLWIVDGNPEPNGWIDGPLRDLLLADVHDALGSDHTAIVRYLLPGGGSTAAFVECLVPPHALVVFGSGPDVVPVVTIAAALGWHVTAVGSRPATGLAERFAAADVLCVTPADAPLEGVMVEAGASVLLMTHNYPRDERILRGLAGRAVSYLGILGPRQRGRRLLAELGPDASAGWNVFAPLGLDLGARYPEEIALAALAEIQAVQRRAGGGPMRERPGPIHVRPGNSTTWPDPPPHPGRAAEPVRGSRSCPS